MASMKILCTGSNGYIGKSFCELADEKDHHVIRDITRTWLNYPDKIYYEDLDAIVHLAASGVRFEYRAQADCMGINFHATRRFFNAILKSGFTPKVFYGGSVYENVMAERLELWDDQYALSKRMASVFVQDWATQYKGPVIQGVIFRCYGSGEVWKVAQQILDLIEA